jgi:FAD-dependent halogenase
MTNVATEEFDVIVIGGGPAGSTAGSFIAMQGHRVLLLEREAFPRHQLGESLLPATVHGICALLGLTEELAKAGFPRKRGGTFRWGNNPKPWTFPFARNTDAPGGFAYQVERARFDKMLLDNSRRKGVDVREQHAVKEIIHEGGRAAGVRFVDSAGKEGSATARYIVDAGGHRARQYNDGVGERVYSKFFQNIALYTYFENGKRLPAPNQGNILSCAFKDGWFWYIPLSSTLTSVGAVVSREAAKLMQDGHEHAFNTWVEACPLIAEYLAPAKRVTTGMYGEYRVRKDFSYSTTAFWKPGVVLIGDAACFIDPVFSSGVHLGTYAALLAARSINTCLKGTVAEERCFVEFENRYRREFGNFYQFLSAFYDMHQDLESYFWAARKILNTQEQANEAFVRLIAGVSSRDEPLFSSSEFFQARIGLGEWFQAVLPEQGMRAEKPPLFDKEKFDPAQFMKGFTSEIVQIQTQALYGCDREMEMPIAPGGLVPSMDGFHWANASAEAPVPAFDVGALAPQSANIPAFGKSV